MYLRPTILSALLLVLSAPLTAATIRVQPTEHLQSIIDRAKPNDTLILGRGSYKGHTFNVHKPLTLIGEGFPVFDGNLKHEVFIVTSSHVTISGIQVQHTGRSSLVDMAGIKLQNVSNVKVTNCKVLNTTYGVYLQNSTHCTIENNLIKSNAKTELAAGNGVHAWKSSNLLIKNNSLSGHRDGIYFEFVTESLIERNVSFNNIRYGLHFMFSHNDTYNYNTFRNNGAGVAVMYTKGVIMTGNNFFHNWGDAAYAILLKDISDSKIENNTFRKNTVGIFMEGSSRIHVSGNQFIDNGWAMRIQASCDANVFEKNNFMGNSFDVATNGSLMLNTFRQNFWDKYDGYDLNRDLIGDVPHYPVSVYSVITERIPTAMILYRSLLTNIMDQVEKVMPTVIPEQLKDEEPRTKKWNL